MTTAPEAPPATAGPQRAAPDPEEVAAALRRAGLGELSHATMRRALYTSDASLFRVVPSVVAYPRDADEVAAALAV